MVGVFIQLAVREEAFCLSINKSIRSIIERVGNDLIEMEVSMMEGISCCCRCDLIRKAEGEVMLITYTYPLKIY